MTRTLLRLLVLPAAAAVALAVTTVNPTALAGAEGLSEADLFAAAEDPELTAVNHDLDRRLEAVAARTAYKEDLTDQLLAGRVTLAAAADGFLRVNQDVPECLSAMRLHFPGVDDREMSARNVIEYARQRVATAAWPAVSRRLTGEYQAAFHHDPQQ